MPVTHAVSRETALDNGVLRAGFREVRDIRGMEAGVHHSHLCPHAFTVTPEHTEDCVTYNYVDGRYVRTNPITGELSNPPVIIPPITAVACYRRDPVYLITEHVGMVLGTGMRDAYDTEQDYVAIVWNPSLNAPETVVYGSTRGYGGSHAEVDATPEVLAAYAAYQAQIAEDHRRRAELEYESLAESKCKAIYPGCKVKVFKGRKVKIGTLGVVLRTGSNQWGDSILLKTDKEEVWVAMGNVQGLCDLPSGMTWTGLWDQIQNAIPVKGDMVYPTYGKDTGRVGYVFATRDEVCGVNFSSLKDSAGKFTDASWVHHRNLQKAMS